MPVRDLNGVVIAARDSFIKRDTSLEKLAALKPSFAQLGAMGMDEHVLLKYPQLDRIEHIHTPGNSSGIVDGASAVLIGSEQAGKDLQLVPRGRDCAIPTRR